MTRIALVASSYLPRLGGVEEHVLHVARELQGRGHEVVVWAVDQHDDAPVDAGGVPTRYLPTPLPNRSVGGVTRFARRLPSAARRWRRAARRDRPQVIDIQCFGANGPYAAALARRTGIPLVYSNHGETFMDANGTFESSSLMRRALRTTLGSAAQVTSCSRYAAGDLVRFGPTPAATVVGNGIDLDLAGSPIPASLPQRYIAGVGRLVANKGFDRLIAAFAEATARSELMGIDLVIGGDGPERAHLEAVALELGIASRVRFTGALDRAQVRTLLDGATAHVVPSIVEAFGIVVLEGWRSGVPVLVTDRGGPPEFVADGVDGLLFDPDDASGLARLIAETCGDDELRARIGGAGRVSAARFSWSAVADSYETVFDAAIATSSADRTRSIP